MNWLIRMYNQNRKMLIAIIIIIVFISLLVNVLNYIASKQLEENNEDAKKEAMELEEVYDRNESLLFGGNSASTNNADEYNNVIETFLNYCLNADVTNAYNLLSTECKEELYPSEKLFQDQYYNNVFDSNKICSYQYWAGRTYQVTISDDILKTGGQGEKTVDYYTLIQEDDNGYRLNINGMIAKGESGESAESNNVSITIENIVQYNEYAIYNVAVKNNTDKTVLLDSQSITDSIYAINENDVEFRAYTEDLYLNDLLINPNSEKNIQISFSTRYSSTINIKSVVFSDIIFDYESYRANAEDYSNVGSIQIYL